MKRWWMAALLAAVPGMASAGWNRAESAHFVVIGNVPAAEVRADAIKLEKYAFILRNLSGRPMNDGAMKLRVFMVSSIDDVEATMPFPAYGVAGFFDSPARGPYLVTPALGRDRDEVSTSRTAVIRGTDFNLVAFHEVAHYFMFENFSAAYPTWYSEGFADFYGTFKLDESPTADKVVIGAPHEWRLQQMQHTPWLAAAKLLTARSYADAGDAIGNLYSEGWLLIHYAANNPARGAQLRTYLDQINAGVSYADAAKAFGDLGVLDAELKHYAASQNINQFSYSFRPIPIGPVAVRPLTPAEEAMWPIDLSLSVGVARSNAGAFQRRARALAGRFPNDAYAIGLLAETEMLVGDAPAAKAAVTRWLALAPADPIALMLRGRLAVDELKAARTPAGDPRWTTARADLIAAIKARPLPVTLAAYYDSFRTEGVLASAGAQNGLMTALRTVPNDAELRQDVAADFEARGMIEDAMAVIRPIAFTIKPDSELSARERGRREKDKARYALLGEDVTRETPRVMYDRLAKRLADARGAPAAGSAH